ncbi:MAG: hypothetical protein QOF78_746 [Phycisphaerales bacterium]|jgi:endonuclease/exonuclease/phosphatase family metal-dependent hydrolase|nr:hypothetical protein [Phycisphaerales bacterium]
MHMKNAIAVFLTVAASLMIGGCGAGAGANQPTRLTVMTYNIHHGAGMDGRLDLPRIARVIRDAKPDLVALQEVDSGTARVGVVDEAAELARLLNMHHAYGPAMNYDGGKYGNAILSRRKIIESRIIPLLYAEGNRREPRAALAATIEMSRGTGAKQIVFISTHLDHTSGSPDRLPQAKRINEAFADLKHPAILAGDFNCQAESEPLAALAADWVLVTQGDQLLTSPADKPRVRIDHVFVKPPSCWRVIGARVIDEAVASDHRPIVVTLELIRTSNATGAADPPAQTSSR